MNNADEDRVDEEFIAVAKTQQYTTGRQRTTNPSGNKVENTDLEIGYPVVPIPEKRLSKKGVREVEVKEVGKKKLTLEEQKKKDDSDAADKIEDTADEQIKK